MISWIIYNEEDVDDDNYTSFYKHDGTVTITDMYNGKYVLKLYNDDTNELIATSNVITVNNVEIVKWHLCLKWQA